MTTNDGYYKINIEWIPVLHDPLLNVHKHTSSPQTNSWKSVFWENQTQRKGLINWC